MSGYRLKINPLDYLKMKSLIVANWKMNGSRAQWRQWALAAVKGINELPGNADIVLCVPHAALADVETAVKNSNRVHLGAQNAHAHMRGAYTGEISLEMLRDFQVDYCILGHSERRAMGETDHQIGEKLEKAVYGGIKPILCIGETLEQKQSGDTIKVLDEQLLTGLNSVDIQAGQDVVIAYEPVWAIGGKAQPPKPAELEEVFRYLRAAMVQAYGDKGHDVPLLYGGSAAPENAAGLAEVKEINGLLAGSVSLDPARFMEMAKVFEQTKG